MSGPIVVISLSLERSINVFGGMRLSWTIASLLVFLIGETPGDKGLKNLATGILDGARRNVVSVINYKRHLINRKWGAA